MQELINTKEKLTILDLKKKKADKERLAMVAVGEFLSAQWAEAAGIDIIGVGEPKKVCAFEIWLFDKNDVRTVTKVLMSEDAFSDQAKRASLAPKGEPVMADSGKAIVLETASLHVSARIVDMQYGGGALPQNSFFNQLTVELSAWRKV